MVQDKQFSNKHRRSVPGAPAPGPNPCIRCYCICFCCFFIIGLITAAGVGIAFAVINPSLPKYVIVDLKSNAFNLTKDSKLHARFVLTVRAENRNKYIGFVYLKDSSVELLFRDGRSRVKLCSGKLPEFKQPAKNDTTMNIELKGDLTKNDFGSSANAFMDKVKTDEIPVVVGIKAPVYIVFHGKEIKKQVHLGADCNMDVDNLYPGTGVQRSDMVYDSTTIKFF